MEQKLLIGAIVKPQGILGEVKIKPFVDDASLLSSLKEIYAEETAYRVLRVREDGEFAYFMLRGVIDRNTAETLRGKNLYLTREEAESLKSNAYFIVDILGCHIFDETDFDYGEVVEITAGGKDVYTCKDASGKVFRFPFLKEMVVSVSPENKRIVVNKKRFSEVTVYED